MLRSFTQGLRPSMVALERPNFKPEYYDYETNKVALHSVQGNVHGTDEKSFQNFIGFGCRRRPL
jgi:hypothetical protein